MCVFKRIYNMYMCECVCVVSVGRERMEKSLASWSQAAEIPYWNVNWYDWSASQITHKAAFNKPKIRMSHHLAPLRQGRGRGCVCVCV